MKNRPLFSRRDLARHWLDLNKLGTELDKKLLPEIRYRKACDSVARALRFEVNGPQYSNIKLNPIVRGSPYWVEIRPRLLVAYLYFSSAMFFPQATNRSSPLSPTCVTGNCTLAFQR